MSVDAGIDSLPRSVGVAAEAVIGARRQPERLMRVFERSPVPMVMLDNQRRYIEVNRPARLALRLSLAELRMLRSDDLRPANVSPATEEAWARLIATGCLAGSDEIVSPDGSRLDVVSWGVADALPGLHLFVFAPAGWPDGELLGGLDGQGSDPPPSLSPRELELLELAADGRTGPMIAAELGISPATVKTHFEHIRAKLGVSDRAAAVAKGMRLGLIA